MVKLEGEKEIKKPNILVNLVPIGSPILLMSTQALSSNLIVAPSLRCNSFFARTTTAWRMSPRRTLLEMVRLEEPGDSVPKDFCFCTTTIMRSPECFGKNVLVSLIFLLVIGFLSSFWSPFLFPFPFPFFLDIHRPRATVIQSGQSSGRDLLGKTRCTNLFEQLVSSFA